MDAQESLVVVADLLHSQVTFSLHKRLHSAVRVSHSSQVSRLQRIGKRLCANFANSGVRMANLDNNRQHPGRQVHLYENARNESHTVRPKARNLTRTLNNTAQVRPVGVRKQMPDSTHFVYAVNFCIPRAAQYVHAQHVINCALALALRRFAFYSLHTRIPYAHICIFHSIAHAYANALRVHCCICIFHFFAFT